jgi:hypothetical protein
MIEECSKPLEKQKINNSNSEYENQSKYVRVSLQYNWEFSEIVLPNGAVAVVAIKRGRI